MNAARSTAPENRIDQLRSTVDLIGAVALAAAQIVTVVGTATSIARRRGGCRP